MIEVKVEYSELSCQWLVELYDTTTRRHFESEYCATRDEAVSIATILFIAAEAWNKEKGLK